MFFEMWIFHVILSYHHAIRGPGSVLHFWQVIKDVFTFVLHHKLYLLSTFSSNQYKTRGKRSWTLRWIQSIWTPRSGETQFNDGFIGTFTQIKFRHWNFGHARCLQEFWIAVWCTGNDNCWSYLYALCSYLGKYKEYK